MLYMGILFLKINQKLINLLCKYFINESLVNNLDFFLFIKERIFY